MLWNTGILQRSFHYFAKSHHQYKAVDGFWVATIIYLIWLFLQCHGAWAHTYWTFFQIHSTFFMGLHEKMVQHLVLSCKSGFLFFFPLFASFFSFIPLLGLQVLDLFHCSAWSINPIQCIFHFLKNHFCISITDDVHHHISFKYIPPWLHIL